jgi:hypothetical protein
MAQRSVIIVTDLLSYSYVIVKISNNQKKTERLPRFAF